MNVEMIRAIGDYIVIPLCVCIAVISYLYFEYKDPK